MRWWHKVALVLFPAAGAMVMDILTRPLRAHAREQAARVIGGILSNDQVTVADTIAGLAQDGPLSASNLLDWLSGAVIVLGVAIPVWLLPPSGDFRAALSALTFVLYGHVLARLLIGYHWLSWTQMGLWLLVGAAVALTGSLMQRNRTV